MKPKTKSWKKLLVGIIVLILTLVFISEVIFPVPWAKTSAKKAADLMNVKRMGLGHSMYMADHDGYGPPPDQWIDSLALYNTQDRVFTSPGLDYEEGEHGYAYLKELGGKHLSDIQNQEEIPLIFNSSDLRRNVAGTLDLLPDPPRWEKGNNIIFLDGHAKLHEKTPVFKIKLP